MTIHNTAVTRIKGKKVKGCFLNWYPVCHGEKKVIFHICEYGSRFRFFVNPAPDTSKIIQLFFLPFYEIYPLICGPK
jgi:hypothetical protein